VVAVLRPHPITINQSISTDIPDTFFAMLIVLCPGCEAFSVQRHYNEWNQKLAFFVFHEAINVGLLKDVPEKSFI
jgi:hypothetical protein